MVSAIQRLHCTWVGVPFLGIINQNKTSDLTSFVLVPVVLMLTQIFLSSMSSTAALSVRTLQINNVQEKNVNPSSVLKSLFENLMRQKRS